MVSTRALAAPAPHAGPEQWVHFDMDKLQDFEAGALFVALMMHPAASEIGQRRDTFINLCACFAAGLVTSVATEAAYLRATRPEYFAVTPRAYRLAFKQAKTLLRYRMIAALMARPFVGRAKLGNACKVPSAVGKFVPSNVAGYISSIHDIRSGENLMERAWRPSLPVLHLAIGLEQASLQRGLTGFGFQDPDELIKPRSLPFDFQDIELVRSAIHLGFQAADIIRKDPIMKIDASKLVEIRWVDRG